ncbi:MAG TPA: flagellar basal body L-ring protein FlgH [Gemmatimonadales bacterium]|nr:flagellar basal body L-ring protein FlgH [Gemmatimonadales bacterium]
MRNPGPMACSVARNVIMVAIAVSLTSAGTSLQAQATSASQQVAAPSSEAAETTRKRTSWTSSRSGFVVGDIITVLVDEATLASARKGVSATDRRRRNADFSLSTPGSSDAPGTSMDAGFGTRNDAESIQRGESTRGTAFRTELGVRVMEVSPSGMLRVEGAKTVTVDEDVQEVSVSGWLRPQDVSPRNVVVSDRLADAEITFGSTGNLAKPRGGIIGRILGMIWP